MVFVNDLQQGKIFNFSSRNPLHLMSCVVSFHDKYHGSYDYTIIKTITSKLDNNKIISEILAAILTLMFALHCG